MQHQSIYDIGYFFSAFTPDALKLMLITHEKNSHGRNLSCSFCLTETYSYYVFLDENSLLTLKIGETDNSTATNIVVAEAMLLPNDDCLLCQNVLNDLATNEEIHLTPSEYNANLAGDR